MRKISKILVLVTLIMMLKSCGLFDSGSDTVVDDYDVTWIDTHENRALYKGEELIPAYIYEAGYNEKYVFAKQHPLVNSEDIINLNITNYYIIERTDEIFQDKKIYGPLNKSEFYNLCKNLKIDTPIFQLKYPTDLKW